LLLGLLLATDTLALERELHGIRLGSRYDRTRQMLVQQYGRPVVSERKDGSRDSFTLGSPYRNSLSIGGDLEYHGYVEWVELRGDGKLPDLGFIGNINLGLAEATVSQLLGKPARVWDAPSGSRHYKLAYTNVSVGVRDGIICSIKIDLSNARVRENDSKTALLVLSANEVSALEGGGPVEDLLRDDLTPHCRLRYPIRSVGGLFLVDAAVCGNASGEQGVFTFLLDTGWSGGAVSSTVCRRIGLGAADTEGTIQRKTASGTISLGPVEFSFQAFDVVDSPVLDGLGVDGVLGSSFFLSEAVILNLQSEYICFPLSSLDTIADSLDFMQLRAEYDGGGIWVDFHANGRLLRGYFLDTGANVTSLLPEDVEMLSLRYRAMGRHTTIDGQVLSLTYGPVVMGWPGILRELDYVYQADNPGYRKIGTDLMGTLIIGIDAASGRVYISD